jgi:hypothetical protein
LKSGGGVANGAAPLLTAEPSVIGLVFVVQRHRLADTIPSNTNKHTY